MSSEYKCNTSVSQSSSCEGVVRMHDPSTYLCKYYSSTNYMHILKIILLLTVFCTKLLLMLPSFIRPVTCVL
jgi:hypothetical protein